MVLLPLAGYQALFCEAAQKLYATDLFAAVVARRLAEGPAPLDSIIAACVRLGMAPTGVADAVMALLGLWSDSGLLAIAPPLDREVSGRFRFELAGVAIDVSVIGDAPLPDIDWPALCTEPAGVPAACSWQIRAGPQRGAEPDVVIARNGGIACIVKPAEAVPTLKAGLVDSVLRATDRIALHTAMLVRHGRALLLSGAPGAGKSTLAVGLTMAGFGYAGDDIALLDEDAMLQGVAFHPTLKQGSWDLLPACRDVLAAGRVHRRRDGAVLRYLPVSESCRDRHEAGWIVVLDRQEGAPARIDPIEPLAALETLLQGAFSRSGRSSVSDLRVLGQLVSGATCWRLTYGNLEGAVELLDRATKAA
ncbi:hypothetical protein WBP07_28210 [Novosphingobium sp. BL-8A]|uniref:hypothetical protein n=1 Tax=Novosphingobium sp. BL-8A TaxID=3127639 RepID=UPI003756402B